MQMNSLMVCLYTIINPWLFTMNSVSTPISQAYDSLAIVKMSHPEKNHFFPKMFILIFIIIFLYTANVNQNETFKILFISPYFHTSNMPMEKLMFIVLVHKLKFINKCTFHFLHYKKMIAA